MASSFISFERFKCFLRWYLLLEDTIYKLGDFEEVC